MRRLPVVALAVVGIATTWSQARPRSADAASGSDGGGAIVFSGEGNNLDVYQRPPFKKRHVVITTRAKDPKGLDINAQIRFFPHGTTARSGSSPARTRASRTRPRAGASSP